MNSSDKRRERYHADAEYRERVKAANRASFKRKYENDAEWREEYKAKCREARRVARADPDYREAERARARKRAAAKRQSASE